MSKGTSTVTKLTKTVCDRAEALMVDDKPRQRLIFDTSLKGFGICVGTKSKTFFVQRNVNGTKRRVTVGRYGEITVEQARTDASELLHKMRKGINPTEERRKAAVKGITLRESLGLLGEYLQHKAYPAKTIKGYCYAAEKYLSDWMNRPLAEITRVDIYNKHRQIAADVAAGKYATITTAKGNTYTKHREGDDGRYTANRTMRTFRRIYNRARQLHDSLPPRPWEGVAWFPEARRRTAIKGDSLADWYSHTKTLANPIRRDFLLFTLFTGLRRKNASELRWEHINFQQRALHVAKPKSKRPFDLPLSDSLIELLQLRQRDNEQFLGNSPWVFPAESRTGHISEPKLSAAERKRAKVLYNVHDLRRTFITVAESLDISPYAIKALVNHGLADSNDVTAGYITHDLERLRAPMQKITDRLLALCAPKEENNVVRLSDVAAKKA